MDTILARWILISLLQTLCTSSPVVAVNIKNLHTSTQPHEFTATEGDSKELHVQVPLVKVV